MSEPFDFEAFIAGTQLAQSKTGFFRVDNRVKIAELAKQYDEASVDADTREGSGKTARKKIADQIEALRDEMEKSRVDITLRSLTPEEFQAVAIGDEPSAVYGQLATQSVEPKLDAGQWKRLADAIGYAQFAQITADANDLVLSKVAVPDFSPSDSETTTRRASSEN